MTVCTQARRVPRSARTRRRRSARAPAAARLVLAVVAALAPLASAAPAATVRGIRAMLPAPIAPRGGVMMLPLGAERPGRGWPATIDLTLESGVTVAGAVVWIGPGPIDAARPRRWTDDPSGVAVRAIRDDDDTTVPGGGAPYLLARLPSDGAGPIRLGAQVLHALWRDPQQPYDGTPLPEPDAAPLVMIAAPDRPDPDSPLEYWRALLLADRLGRSPPPLDAFEPAAALVAEHYTDLWRIGLAHLAERHAGVAATCRDWLTRICQDGRHSFAAWETAPDAHGSLLTILLDLDRGAGDTARDAVAWSDSRAPLIVWPESRSVEALRLAVVNRSFRPVIARLSWEGGEDLPIAIELPPGALTRVDVDRPPPAFEPGALPAAGGGPAISTLIVATDVQTVRLPVTHQPVATARPPGVFLPPLRPPITLAEAMAERQRVISSDRATTAQLRRRAGRWEVFFECRRPPPRHDGDGNGAGQANADRDADAKERADPLAAFARGEDVRGVEAIVLSVGPVGAPTAVLGVPEHGAHRLLAGADEPGLQIHTRSYADLWYCRIVLPRAWLEPETTAVPSVPPPPPERVLLGALRAHGDGAATESTPDTVLPWETTIGRLVIDLSAWDGNPRRGGRDVDSQ